MKFIGVFLFLLSISVCSSYTKAQILKSIFFENPGIQVGLYQGQTEFEDFGNNYYFRLYNQHVINNHFFGEFSLSSGNISGLNYRSRLTPLEYRVGMYLRRLGVPEPILFKKKGALYTYLGIGVLYSKPIDIAAPDDPLTIEMGNRLSTSLFWNFDGGFAPVIPFGIGMDINMDNDTRLNVTAGYNPSLQFLKFNSKNVPAGYWGFSIGLDFGRAMKAPQIFRLPPAPIKQYQPKSSPHEVQLAVVEAADVRVAKISERSINFPVLSSDLDEKEHLWLKEVANLMNQNTELCLNIIGHADATGTDPVNIMISQSRARAVWLALVDEGINPDRFNVMWYADNRPLASNKTEGGRFRNRRVELQTTTQKVASVKQPEENEIYTASIFQSWEFERPLLPTDEILFDRTMTVPDRYGKMLLQLTSYWLHKNAEIELVILSQAEIGPGAELRKSLAKSRAELIREKLILNGVSPDRIKAALPDSDLYNEYSEYLEKDLQQNLMIPRVRD